MYENVSLEPTTFNSFLLIEEEEVSVRSCFYYKQCKMILTAYPFRSSNKIVSIWKHVYCLDYNI